MRTLVGNLVAFVAVIKHGDVPLLCDFHALFVGEFHKAPELHAVAGGPAVMEAVSAAFLLHVAHAEISPAPQRLDSLIQQRFGFADVFLIERYGRPRSRRGVRRQWGPLLRPDGYR